MRQQLTHGDLSAHVTTHRPSERHRSQEAVVRRTSRNVKRWQSGEMCLRWTAAGMLEAERQFRRIIGYHDLAKLVVAIDNERNSTDRPTPTEAAIVLTA